MHRIFGKQEKEVGFYRPGAYLIPVRDGNVAVAKVLDRLYLLGGGIEGDETQEACIHRECLEEAGYSCEINGPLASAEWYVLDEKQVQHHYPQYYYWGTLLEKKNEPTECDHELVWIPMEQLRGKMHLEMQNWALEQYWEKMNDDML